MPDTLRNKTIRNIGYNSIAKIIQLVIHAFANIILTRTLLPSDYGIVSFAGIFISFLVQFGDLGIRSAVIQKKELSHKELYIAFTIKAVLGSVIFLVAFICAPLAAIFSDNQDTTSVVQVLAFGFILNTFSFLPNILLTRDLDYKKLSYINILSALLNSIIAVILALAGFKYWSLVVASICGTIASAILINIIHPVRYRFAYDSETARGFLLFGGNLFLNGLTVFLIFNADNFLIGTVKGSINLGYYSIAFSWGSMVCTTIGSIVLSVLFPTFSKIQENREMLKISYLMVLRYVSFGGILVNMTLFVVSRDFLVLVLGHNTDKWLPALSAFRILCFYGIVRLLLEPVGQVLLALGRTNILRKATLLAAAIELSCLYPALYFFGIEGAAVLVTVAYISQYAIYYQSLNIELHINFVELRKCVAPAFLSIIPLGIFFLAGEAVVGTSALIIITKVSCCIGIYLTTYGIASKWTLYKDMRRQMLHLNL